MPKYKEIKNKPGMARRKVSTKIRPESDRKHFATVRQDLVSGAPLVRNVYKFVNSADVRKDVIYATKDYEPFTDNLDKLNREVEDRKDLVESLEKYGHLPSHPIACYLGWDDDLGKWVPVTLDGQHRVRAVIASGKLLYFIIVAIPDFDIIPMLNTTSSRWKLRNYAAHRKNDGCADYAWFEAMQDYVKDSGLMCGDTSIINLLQRGCPMVEGEHVKDLARFKTGEFKVNFLDQTVDIIDGCARIRKAVWDSRPEDGKNRSKFVYSRPFLTALSLLYWQRESDHEFSYIVGRLVANAERLEKPADTAQAVTNIERVVNYRRSNKKPALNIARWVALSSPVEVLFQIAKWAEEAKTDDVVL